MLYMSIFLSNVEQGMQLTYSKCTIYSLSLFGLPGQVMSIRINIYCDKSRATACMAELEAYCQPKKVCFGCFINKL